MKHVVRKNNLGAQIVYKSSDPPKKRRHSNLGYTPPVTGKRFDFWRYVFHYMGKPQVVSFMNNSGRQRTSKDRQFVGTDFCNSDEDLKLVQKLNGRENSKKLLKLLIKEQYGNTI